MLDRDIARDRSLPTFITLTVIGFLLMTFDTRLQGEGLMGSLRVGTQTLVAPLQQAASAAVDPVADMIEGLAQVAALQAENEALRAEAARAQGELASVEDDLARLAVLEQIYNLQPIDVEVARTEANVIGLPDGFGGASFVVDKGSDHGVRAGHPVIDPYGYLVGKVRDVTAGSATVVPITRDRDAVIVLTGGQVGMLASQLGSDLMKLEVLDAREPLFEGQLVVTSSVSINFPQGLPVGEVTEDAPIESTSVTAKVRPFTEPELLRVVVILTWPVDPNAGQGSPTTTIPAGGDG
jgi:rod shape-determining protein MreC